MRNEFGRLVSILPRPGEGQLCRLLHVNLILLYVALIIIASQHYEHGLNFPFSSAGQTTISVTVSIISQAFGTLYLAVLVLVTQRLALIHDLHTRQTLTAIHDKTSAWLGLGSALLTLLDQIKLPSAASSVAFIGVYLTGIATLHIAIPASVGVNTYNATVATQQTTQLARPLFYSEDPVSFDILSVYNQFPQIGLQDNMIYDVLPVVPTAVNNATVNATIFNVSCGPTPSGIQVGLPDLSQGDDISWPFQFNATDKSFVTRQLGLLAPATLTLGTIRQSFGLRSLKSYKSDPWAVLVQSTIPVLDAAQERTGSLEMNPAMAWYDHLNFTLASARAKVETVQIFMCNTFAFNTTISVSAATRQPILSTPPPETALWTEWPLSLDEIPVVQDPLLDALTEMCGSAPGATHKFVPDLLGLLYNTTSLGDAGNNSFYSVVPISSHYSLVDQFIIQDLGLGGATGDPPSRILLSDFQRSLSKAMAAVLWYDRNGNHSSAFAYNNFTLSQADEARIGQATVEILTLRIRLNFNIVPLAVGLGVSCLLFALTFPLTGDPTRHHINSDLDAAGILQLTWLLGNESHFAGIHYPERQELRRAGLFDVQMSAWAQQKVSRHSSDSDLLEELALNNSREGCNEV